MRLLRNRDFVILCAGQAVSMVGSQVSQLALPLLVLDVSGSAALTGVFIALRTVPPLVLLLPAGAWLDRWDRKRAMLLSDAARALILAGIPLGLAFGWPMLPLLGLAALAEGVFNTFFSVAETACLPQVVRPDQLAQAVSIDRTTEQVSHLVGPSLGGALYSLGRAIPFAVDALSYAASVVSLLFIRVPFQQARAGSDHAQEHAPSRTRLLDEIRVGVRFLAQHPVLRVLVVLVGGLNFCSYGYPLIMIVRAQELGADAAAIGLIFASGGVGGIVGSLLAPRLLRRYGAGPMLLVTSWLWVILWPPTALAPTLGWLAIVEVLAWVVVVLHGITHQSYRLASVPDVLQGRVNSVFRLIAFGGQPLSLALSGLLLQSFGAVATVWLITLPQALLVLVTTWTGGLRAVQAPHELPQAPVATPLVAAATNARRQPGAQK
jgi:MFS family permease